MANNKEALHRYIGNNGNATIKSVDIRKFLVSSVTTLCFYTTPRTQTGGLGIMGFPETKLSISVGTSVLCYFDWWGSWELFIWYLYGSANTARWYCEARSLTPKKDLQGIRGYWLIYLVGADWEELRSSAGHISIHSRGSTEDMIPRRWPWHLV
jgi:hypothetical protein